MALRRYLQNVYQQDGNVVDHSNNIRWQDESQGQYFQVFCKRGFSSYDFNKMFTKQISSSSVARMLRHTTSEV